jgi:hypothetical protein
VSSGAVPITTPLSSFNIFINPPNENHFR